MADAADISSDGGASKVQAFWFGKTLPDMQRACLSSFVHHGHKVDLYTYDAFDVPDGIDICDAATILPKSRLFFYESGPGKGSVSAFSNLFRYKLLSLKGGWWVDSDIVCTGRPLPSVETVFFWQHDGMVGSAAFRLPTGSALGARLLRDCEAMGTDFAWAEAGPFLLTSTIRSENYLDHVLPAEMAYSVHYDSYKLFSKRDSLERIMQLTESSCFIHLWHEAFRRDGPEQNVPEEGSFLAWTYDQYLKSGSIHVRGGDHPTK